MHYMHMSNCGAELFSRLVRAELIFCKNAGASDGEWVRSLIHLSGKHSFFLPPPIWPFLSSSTILSVHLLHTSFILCTYSLQYSQSQF